MKSQANVEISELNSILSSKQDYIPTPTKTNWQIIQEDYKNRISDLKTQHYKSLSTELLSKQSKDTYALASVFKDIANSNMALAQADATSSSLRLQYYNDSAIACYHGLSVIEKSDNSNKNIELQELKNEIYASLNDIQTNIVNVGGGNPDKLQQINSKEDADNIARRDILKQLRNTTKDQLQAIEVAKEDKDDISYIERTASLFKQVASGMENYLAALYKDAQNLIGNPPCDYTVIGLGSMALRQMTPYSDLEFAILTANEDYKQSDDFKVREYFKNLTQIVHFKVINLGETIMPISSYGFDFKEFIKTAVNFDLGGKTPLGRIDKPYELIQTVENMLKYLRNEEGWTMRIDKTLQNIVQKTCLIYQYGENNLAAKYQNLAQEFLLSTDESNGRPYCENRGVQILAKGGIERDYTKQLPQETQVKGNLEQFAFDHESGGKLFDVKQEIYRMPDRFIYYLGLIYGVQEESSWDTINKLCKKELISKEGAFNLKKALSFATNLRLKTYSHYGYQKEVMDYAKAYEIINVQSKDKLIEEELTTTFRLTPEDLKEGGALFEYYYVALSLSKKLKEFCNLPETEKRKTFFADTEFYQDDAYTKATINLRLTKYEEALKYQLKTLEINLQFLGKNHASVATSLNNIGMTYGNLGNYNKALEYHIKALEIFQKSLAENHPDIANILNNIGMTYRNLGNNSKALECQEKALEIRQKSLAKDHQHVATSLNNIGMTYRDLGNNSKALEYLKKSLKILQKTLGEDHSDVAQSLNNIGLTYGDLGNYNKALEYHIKALEIFKKSLQEDHPHVATSLNNIGGTYSVLGNHSKALEYQEKALKIFPKSLGKDHPEVATSLNNIGMTYRDLGNHKKALEHLEKALEIRQKFLGKDHPHVATSLNNIGLTYGDLGRYNEALEYLEKALERFQKSLGEDHPDIVTCYKNLKIVESRYIKNSNIKIEKLSSEGINAYKKQNYSEAIEKYDLALKIVDKILSYNAKAVNNKASLYYNIARSYHNDNNLEQALLNYNKVYQLNDKHDKARDYFYECAKTLYLQQSTNPIENDDIGVTAEDTTNIKELGDI